MLITCTRTRAKHRNTAAAPLLSLLDQNWTEILSANRVLHCPQDRGVRNVTKAKRMPM